MLGLFQKLEVSVRFVVCILGIYILLRLLEGLLGKRLGCAMLVLLGLGRRLY
jgi:hypothetical protein